MASELTSQSVRRSGGLSVCLTFNYSGGQSVSRAVGRSDSPSVSRVFGRSVSHSVSQSVIQSDYVLYAKYHVPQLLQSVFVDKILESAGSLAALFNVLLSARALRT